MRFGKRVAFLGLDVNDDAGNARHLLADHPVSYPSYTDEGGRIATSLGGFVGLPTTVFVDTAGKVTFVHAGEYRDDAALAQDIENHALR